MHDHTLRMLTPPFSVFSTITSRRIFFFFTGLSTLITTVFPVSVSTPLNTSLYFPRPSLHTIS